MSFNPIMSFNRVVPHGLHVVRYGFSTTEHTTPVQCPNCKNKMYLSHQPFLHNPCEVCVGCFDQVRLAGETAIKNK